ncbi:MAG: DUF421 domain-containing protein [Ignavibacteriales bacterium]
MDLNYIWKTVLIFIIGKFLLRLSGRRSIAQMTTTQMTVLIGMDILLVQPLHSKDILTTSVVALTLVILMIITEYLEMKFNFIESLFVGKAIIVIENGNINIKNLSKLRMSIDILEIKLRQAGISKIGDIEYATIEPSGELGYKIKDSKAPLTKDNFINAMSDIDDFNTNIQTKNDNNIFKEIKSKKKKKES